MTTATQTLADWLLDQIKADENAARVVLGDYAQHKPNWDTPSTAVVDLGDPGIDGLLTTADGPVAEHVARWDPARVLAECEAKRKLVEYADGAVREGQRLYHDGYDAESGAADACEAVLRLLALPYADRPGYRQEWTP